MKLVDMRNSWDSFSVSCRNGLSLRNFIRARPAAAVIALAGCGTTTAERTGTGAALGAATGAAIGSFSGNAGKGALIGAGVGALGGYAYDDVKRKEEEQRLQQQQQQQRSYNYY